MKERYIADYLFILNNSGLPLLVFESDEYQSTESTPDPMLISGFLAAIQSFLKEITNKDLKVIDSLDEKIIITRSSKVSVAAITRVPLVNQLLNRLSSIANNFEKKYGEQVNSPNLTTNTFSDFQVNLQDQLKIDQFLRVNTNDIFKKLMLTLYSLPTDYVKDTYGERTYDFFRLVDGERTVHHILRETNSFNHLDEIQQNFIQMQKGNLIKKIPQAQRKIAILHRFFNLFIDVFTEKIGKKVVVKDLKKQFSSTDNKMVALIDFNPESLALNFDDLKQLLSEDPTLALTEQFENLPNILISFIADMQIEGKTKLSDINKIIAEISSKMTDLYPEDPEVDMILTKIDFMKINF